MFNKQNTRSIVACLLGYQAVLTFALPTRWEINNVKESALLQPTGDSGDSIRERLECLEKENNELKKENKELKDDLHVMDSIIVLNEGDPGLLSLFLRNFSLRFNSVEILVEILGSALYKAVHFNVDCFRVLLDHIKTLGEDTKLKIINYQGTKYTRGIEYTPLMKAVQVIQQFDDFPKENQKIVEGWIQEIVTLLLQNGADPQLKNELGETAFDLLRDTEYETLLNKYSPTHSEPFVKESALLQPTGDSNCERLECLQKENNELEEALDQAFEKISMLESNLHTMDSIIFLNQGRPKFLQAILQKYQFRSVEILGTALLKAVHSNVECFHVLLDYIKSLEEDTKLKIMNYQKHFDTPLINAVLYMENNEVVTTLLQNGADPHLKNRNSQTAFDLSCNPDYKHLMNQYVQD